jgi:hypothetical protein
MAQKKKDTSFRALIDRFTSELTAAIARQVEDQVSVALAQLHKGAQSDGRRSGRLCPVPGCG